MKPAIRIIPIAAIVFAIAFGVTLAYLIGQRLPPDALPVIAGVMIGAGVAIPTTLLFAGILTSDNLRPLLRPFHIPYNPHKPHITWIQAEPTPPFLLPEDTA